MVPSAADAGSSIRGSVAAIVLNFRTPELACAALASLLPELDPERDRAWVVDNSSGDDSAARIRAWIEAHARGRVELIVTERNGGFASGMNSGLARARAHANAESFLLLNSDAQVAPGAVARLAEALARDPRVGLVGPRILAPDGSVNVSSFRFHTPLSELICGSDLGLVRALLQRFDVPLAPERAAAGVAPEWISFACVLMSRACLDAVGSLDEGFFMYYEDVDFCRRARAHGFLARLEPSAEVVHAEGASSGVEARRAQRQRLPRYYFSARGRYFRKHFGAIGLLTANLLWSAGFCVAGLRALLGGKPLHTAQREWFDRWRG